MPLTPAETSHSGKKNLVIRIFARERQQKAGAVLHISGLERVPAEEELIQPHVAELHLEKLVGEIF